MQTQLQQKQTLLRKEIIQGGVDAEAFMEFMGKVKNQGENIDLENWTMEELTNAVSQFKNQLNKSIQEFISSKIVLNSSVRKSIIFDTQKKEKVKYNSTNLWDYQMNEKQECVKVEKVFKIPPNIQPLIKIEQWEIKAVGGFIFGIGSRNQLNLTISSNFYSVKVVRKGEDCDWLKHILSIKHVGHFVPPLENQRQFSSDDTKGINARVKQIENFLNCLLRYPVFYTSKHLLQFLQQDNPKKFTEYKSKESSLALQKDIDCFESPTGQFKAQISQKLNITLRQSSQIVYEFNHLYAELNSCFSKIVNDMQNLSKSIKHLSEVTSKVTEKYGEIQNTLSLQNQMRLPTMLLSLGNTIGIIDQNLKKHTKALLEFNQSFVKDALNDWNQFSIFDKKHQNQLKNYLSSKQILIRKKQKYVSDASKWQLPEPEFVALTRRGINKMTKQQCFEKMFPYQNELQNQLRLRLAFYNQNYLNSYKLFLLEQQKDLFNRFLTYSSEYVATNVEVRNSYQGFNEIYFQ